MTVSNEMLNGWILAEEVSGGGMPLRSQAAISVYKELIEARAKLNRLAKLEEACRKIVADAPSVEPVINGYNRMSTEVWVYIKEYEIAQKLKAALEEA